MTDLPKDAKSLVEGLSRLETGEVAAPNPSPDPNQAVETQDLTQPIGRSTKEPGKVANTMPMAFGRYAVKRVLGSGAFGMVYLGHDRQLDRLVAIKVHRSDRTTVADPLQELLLEARRVAKLRHPGIAAVHDVGVEEDFVYIVSDYVQGGTLRERLANQRFRWQEGARIVAAIADAVGHAHSLRVVHRDIKPANIIITSDLKPILVDFGLGLDESRLLTNQRGVVAGTPAYMAPEQAAGEGHRIDGRTDIYALGALLYELVTGHVPFRAGDTYELLRQVREDDPQPLRQLVPQIPHRLEQICLKALAKKISDRFTTAGDMADALNELLAEDLGRHPALSADAGSASGTSPTSGAVPSAPAPFDSGKLPKSSVKREAERRQLTLLACACDLFESSEFIENLDSEEQHRLLHEYQDACAAVIKEFGGTIVQMTEPLILACFGFPVAHEDSAARAVRTGLGILKSVGEVRARLLEQKGFTFTIAVSVHTGMAVASESPEGAGREAYSVVGEARNVITRLEGVMKPEMVVISKSAYRLVQGYFLCESLGNVAVKGVARPIEFFRVIRENESTSRLDVSIPSGLTPLVGRDREVGLLQDRWEQATEGMGQVVLIIGDAGLGKSRLLHVIKEHVKAIPAEESFTSIPGGRGEPLAPIIEWRCTPRHQNSGLYPVIEFLERQLCFGHEETPEEKFQKLHDQLASLGLATGDVVPFLAALLSLPITDRYEPLALSPARQKEKTIEAIREYLRAFAERQPFLFIVEDLHWIDPSTLEFLTFHVEAGFNDRVLTILTFRPEFETPWKTKAHQTVMALNRLTKKQMTEMMQRKMGVTSLPNALVEQIVAKTDGVPLFVEEYTSMVMESDHVREINGHIEMASSYTSTEIPATLHDLLLARLDRMASNREVVQVASALGRAFSYELIRAVLPMEESTLQAELEKLVAAELLHPKGRPPQISYMFKHALIQDAAYQSLVKSKKQQIHRRILVALESGLSEIVQKEPEMLAHHSTEAGLVPQAIDWWTKAGHRSMERGANAEAASHLGRGLELLGTLPESAERTAQELTLQLMLGTVLIASQGYAAPRVGTIFTRARELCVKLNQPQSLMAVLWGQWAWRVVREELDLCLQLADEATAFAQAQADDGISMETAFMHGLTRFYRGNFAEASEHCRQGLALYDADRCVVWSRYTGQNSGATLRCYLGLSLWCLGYPDQAIRIATDAVKLASDLAHPYTKCFAYHHLAWLQIFLRLGKEAQSTAATEISIADEQGFPFWKATGTLGLAGALVLQGKAAAALDEARQGLVWFNATGAHLSLAHYLGYMADAQTHLGRHTDALRSIDDAIVSAQKNHNEFYLAELYRLKGEILLKLSLDHQAAASQCFQDSLAVAEKQQAKSWVLRTTMSLGKLWHLQGRTGDARIRLADILDWFTEGFTSPDLVDAKKLLEEWA